MSNTRLPKLSQSTQNQPCLSRRKLYAAMLVASQWMAAGQLWAAPEGGEVVGGEGVITQSGVDTMIHQATERMAIDWRSFDVAANERVEFIQPSSSSIALNRVLSNSGSQILGRIESNGQVMLVNPNGVVFGKDSIINVGGMIASGMNIDPASFINGDFTLNSLEGTDGKVINYGIINAATGGSVTLVGQQVQNDGLISAKLGAVNLAAGNEAVLTFDQSGLVGVKVTKAVLQNELGVDAAVINNGEINAEGGRVLLSASVSEDIFSNAVNNSGMNKSSSVVVHDDGSFTLGAGADVINTGDINTSVATGAAGQVAVVGNNITSSGTITANTGSGTAGAIELHSTDTTLVTETGNISAQAATQGEGGDIKILGNKVGLFDNAEVNASGADGGGQVLIGGDKTGDNQRVRNADFIYLGENTAVKADALIDGNGGKLITFASDTVRIYGNLYSRGGLEGGNGGFIETSGLKGFEILNTPDITAVAGTGGTWLIDPLNLSITTEASSSQTGIGSQGNAFSPTGANAKLNVGTLNNALVNGSTVYVKTTAAGGSVGQGTITLDAELVYNNDPIGTPNNRNSSATLVLEAADDIVINHNIVRSGEGTGKLSLVLEANSGENKSGEGSVKIISGRRIETQGGDFTATGFNFDSYSRDNANDNNNDNQNFGTIDTSSNVGGGNITIDVSGYADIGALIFKDSDVGSQTQVGNILIKAFGDVSLNREIEFDDTGFLSNESTSLTIESNKNININALIYDKDDGDIDALNISLTADKDEIGNDGVVTFNQDIYTAGGNFQASGYDLVFNSKKIDTENASLGQVSDRSNGGKVTLKSSSDLTLGDIVTDAVCDTTDNCTGNLEIEKRKTADNINIDQATETGLIIAGASTFNTGTGGDITLLNENNNFNGNLIFTSAKDVKLADTTAVVLGASNIDGTFQLNSGGSVTQVGALSVAGTTTIKATEFDVVLNNAGNKFNTVNFDGVIGSLDLLDSDGNFSVGNVNTQINNENGGDIKIANTANGGQLTVGTLTTQGGAAENGQVGKNGGAVTLNANGAITVDVINTSGSTGNDTSNNNFEFDGGTGGNVSITSTSSTVTLKAITTDGGNGDADGNTNNDDANGGSAGNITIKGTEIELTDSLLARGGRLEDYGTANKDNGLGGTVSLTGNVKINNPSAAVRIDTTLVDPIIGSATKAARSANVTITGNITGATSYANALTVNADQFIFAGDIGSITNFLGDLTILSTKSFGNAQTDIYAKSVAITSAGITAKSINTKGNANNVGGSVSLVTTPVGIISVSSLDTSGGSAVTNGLKGGNVVITGNNITLGSIKTSGSNAVGSNNSGAAGTVVVTASGTGATISLNGDITTQNGAGNNQGINVVGNFTLFNAGTFNLGHTDFYTSNIKLVGSSGDDVINGFNVDSNWTLSGAGTGIVSNTDNSKNINFESIESLIAGTAIDKFTIQTAGSAKSIDGGSGPGKNTLTGHDDDNTWNITDTDTGTLNNVIAFSKFQNLIGGTGADTFNFTNAAGVITGSVNGGDTTENNKILGRNTATTWTLTTTNTGKVEATDGTTYIGSFSNIQNLTGGTAADIFDFATINLDAISELIIDGGVNADNTIKSKTGIENTWSMSGNNAGSLIATASPLTPYIKSFDNVQVFTGANNDTMSYENFTADNVQVTLGLTGTTGITSFIGKVGVDSEIIKIDGTNVWTITGKNKGTVKEDALTEISFSDFNKLTGGTGKDTFDFSKAIDSEITGAIDGGATAEGNEIVARKGDTSLKNTWSMTGNGSGYLAQTNGTPKTYVNQFTDMQIFTGAGLDTMSYAGATGTVEVKLGASGVSGVSDFVGKEGLTLVGEDEVNLWSITGNNSGTVSFGPSNDVTLINFHNFSNLTGGNLADTFAFTNANGFITGTINGGAGADIITARNSANTWTMITADTGTLAATPATTYLYRFSDIEILNGGSMVDIFNIDHSFNGVINGGDGADIFKFNSALNNGSAISINGGDGDDQLIGRVTDNTWVINNGNGGSLGTNDGAIYVTSFTDLQILTGGIGADTFTINSAYAGAIDAGAGNNIFGVNASVGTLTGGIGNDNFIFGASGRADVIDGDGGINTITGRNTTNTWSTTAVDEGNLSVTNGTTPPYLTNFKNIQHLQGGSAVDIFNIDHKFNGTISGGNAADIFNLNADATKISGGAGNDIFNIYAAVTELLGEAGDDSFLFNSELNAGSATTIDGGAAGENNSLFGRNADNIWKINADEPNSLGSDDENYVTSFTNIQTLNGGSGADNFVINADVRSTINAGGGNNRFTINAAVGAILGGDENETFAFGVAGSATNLNGGGGSNTVVGRDGDNTWTMTAANIGKLEVTNGTTYLNRFENIQTLQGGSEVDIFNLGHAFNETIKGGAGNDIFNVNAVTNILQGEAGDDSFLFNSQSNAGRAASIDGGAAGENNSLSGRNADNIWNITGENSGSLGLSNGGSYVTGFSNIQTLNGGTAVDIFNLNATITSSVHGAAGNDQFFVNAKVGALFGDAGNDHFLFNSENNSGIATDIDGGDGDNEITGRNAINTWSITATDTGSLAETEGTPYITNFTKIQTLNGGREADVFEIGANITRAINSGSGNNIFRINTSVNNLMGGAGNDQFIFGATGFAQSIRGAGGINSLTGRDAANTWNITAANAGNIASYLTNFFEIQTLQGGSGTDTFNINAAVENLFGNAGDDKFLFTSNNNTGSAKSIDGGGGNNTLSGRNAENNWTMLAAQSGELSSLINNNNSIYVENFSSIQNIEGGNVTDTLYGLDQNNDWTITGRNSGNLKAAGALAATQVSFTSIENLVGAQGLDKFTFTTNQSYITGRVNGGSSNTVLDEVNLSGLTDGVVVELGNTLSENLNLFNIESVIANKDAHNSNVLIGASDAAYSWNITATNSGRIQLTDTSSTDIGVSFTNFGELRGGTNDDRFNVAAGASVSKSISGGDGAGEDWVDYSRRTDDVEITLGGDGLTGTGINGIEGVIGNSLLDNNYKSIIRVIDGDNTWTIDELNDGEVSVGGQRVLFENFNQLIGGSGADTFNYSTQGQLVGLIDGGTGTNRVNASQSTKDHEFHLNGTVAGVTNLVRITELTANAATNSALVSTASANTWTVNSQGIGILNGIFNFSGIANLTGGAFIDEFNLASISPFTGIIDGGTGSAADEIKLNQITTDISVGIGATAVANLKVANIESINANADRTNTFIADNLTGNTWLISGANSGTLNTSIAFSGFSNLAGREAADTFTYASELSNISGWIDAGGGVDKLNLTNSNRNLVVRIVSNNSVVNSGEVTANNFESIDADADNNNKLIAKDTDNTWSITSTNGGSLNDGVSPALAFTNFNNLTGGNQNDRFNFDSLGIITGLIDGAGQRERDIVDVSKSLNTNIKIAAATATSGYSNIEKYIGNNTTSTITADNTANNWVVTNNSGALNSTIEFEQFVNLVGGNDQDIFTLNNAILSGYIDGADGNDRFTLTASAVAGELRGGLGDDEFTINVVSGFAGNTNLNGGLGANRLIVTGGDAGYKATHQQSVLEYENSAKAKYTVSYAGITGITDNVVADSLEIWGTSANDVFRLQNNKYQLDPALSISYSQKQDLIIRGSSADQVVLDGTVTIPKSMIANNASLTAENGGKLIAQSLELIATQGVGSASNRVQLAVNDLYLKSTNGDIYLNEQDSLNLKEFFTSATNIFDVVLGGDLLSASGISFGGQFNVDALRGGIALNNANSFSGLLNLKAASDISIKNLNALSFTEVAAQNLTIDAEGEVSSTGAMMVNGLTSIATKSNISLLHADNDLNSVRILAANNLSLRDKNSLTLAGVSALGNVAINTSGNINIGSSCTDNCTDVLSMRETKVSASDALSLSADGSYGIRANNVNIDAGIGAITVGKNITANDSVALQGNGITVNDTITAKRISLKAGSGVLLLNKNGSLSGQAGDLIDLAAVRVDQRANITGGADINVTAVEDIQMAADAITESVVGNVVYSGRNIALGTIKSINGVVNLKADGAITDTNDSNINIYAHRWVADAISGIGIGNLGDAGQDAIETDVDVLSVMNAGKPLNNSTINILNTDSLIIEQLRNNGDISIANLTGDIVLDNTNNTPFDIKNPDARLQGGVINANTGLMGGKLTLSIPNGMVVATNKADKSNPDIIAERATFVYSNPPRYGFGDRNRKIVMHIPAVYNQSAKTSSVVWHIKKPLETTDTSTPLKNLNTTDQLIQIEGLSEIDPAIFTNVRNYVHDEVAILMPADQRFDDDE